MPAASGGLSYATWVLIVWTTACGTWDAPWFPTEEACLKGERTRQLYPNLRTKCVKPTPGT